MSGRTYYIPLAFPELEPASGDKEILILEPADERPFYLVRFQLERLSDLGEAELEGLRIEVIVGHTSIPAGGGPIESTLGRDHTSHANPAFNATTNQSTLASAGSPRTLISAAWVDPYFEYTWDPDHRPLVTQAQTSVVFRSNTTVSDAIQYEGNFEVKAIG